RNKRTARRSVRTRLRSVRGDGAAKRGAPQTCPSGCRPSGYARRSPWLVGQSVRRNGPAALLLPSPAGRRSAAFHATTAPLTDPASQTAPSTAVARHLAEPIAAG